MFVSDLCRAPLLAAVPLLQLGDRLTFPLLLGIVFAIGVFSTPYLTAQRLIIPETSATTSRSSFRATRCWRA